MTRVLTLHFCNCGPNARLANSLPKIEMDFEKGNRTNHAAAGTEKDRKIAVYQLI